MRELSLFEFKCRVLCQLPARSASRVTTLADRWFYLLRKCFRSNRLVPDRSQHLHATFIMSLSMSAVLQRPTPSRAFFVKRSAHNRPRARCSISARGSLDASLPLLTQRIQQLKDSESQNQWPGYSQWRESQQKNSNWSGYIEWRTTDKAEEERMMNSLRLRLSKPHVEDRRSEKDHFDQSSSLDAWHRSCWQQFRDSTAFDNSDDTYSSSDDS